MLCWSLFVLLYFFFGHCVICPSIYGFWLPLWYLQTLLKIGEYNQLFRNCFCPINDKNSLKTPKLQSEDVNRIRTYTIKAKRTTGQTMIYKTLQSKLSRKTKNTKTRVPEGFSSSCSTNIVKSWFTQTAKDSGIWKSCRKQICNQIGRCFFLYGATLIFLFYIKHRSI